MVEYFTFSGRKKIGLFSNFIQNLIKTDNFNQEIPLFIQEGNFPQIKITDNLIMISTGTGIAPIRNILWERYSIIKNSSDIKDVGSNLLFYGCRYRKKDYLYGEEFELFKNCEKMK